MLKDLQELICELVAIESVNPDLVPSGSGEGAIARFVASWLADAGLDVEIVEPVPGRPSVVGVLHGSGSGKDLMLNAHMDTVGAGGMANPFTPVVRDGRVYGRGAYDMKASLAAIMLAAREAPKLKGDLIITAVADEEVASLGTSAVLEKYQADYCIVTEPTELRLCLAHKGFVWLEVETKGVAAHGSRADLGVDAIALMGPALTHILDLENTLKAGQRHPLLGTGSIHASLIEGGQELSTYPSRCVVKIERRTIPGEKLFPIYGEVPGEAGEQQLFPIYGEVPGEAGGWGEKGELFPIHGEVPGEAGGRGEKGELFPIHGEVPGEAGGWGEKGELFPIHGEVPGEAGGWGGAKVRVLLERPPSELSGDHPVSQAVAKAAGNPEVIGVAYWMDMALTNAAGIPTVAFGPSGEGAHADVEWVDLASVEKCVDVYVKAAQLLCS